MALVLPASALGAEEDGSPGAGHRPADCPPDFVPFGAYWAWERTDRLAAHLGLERWEYVGRQLDLLKTHGLDTVWAVNFGIPDLAPMLQACHERSLRFLPGLGAIHYDLDWRHNNWDYYDEQFAAIREQLDLAGDAAGALLGWVLCDEPRKEALEGLEELRRRFADFDPERPSLAVTMWPVTPAAIETTRLPILCTDLYPFFGPGDPNGPHTPSASRRFYVANQERYVRALGGTDRVHWIMFQCYAEVWGPWQYDDNYHIIALPGAYMHWVCPTEAQMRWQVWAGLKCGSKGFLCFLGTPTPPDPESSQRKPPEQEILRPVLATEPTDVGPSGLFSPDGTATPQLVAMGEACRQLAAHRELIRRWVPTQEPLAAAQPPLSLGSFAEAEGGRAYVVVVNDEWNADARGQVLLPADTKAVRDLVVGASLTLARAGDAVAVEVALPPGGGTILALE